MHNHDYTDQHYGVNPPAALNGGTSVGLVSQNKTTSTDGAHTHTLSIDFNGSHSHGITVNATGGAETRPDSIMGIACIRYQ